MGPPMAEFSVVPWGHRRRLAPTGWWVASLYWAVVHQLVHKLAVSQLVKKVVQGSKARVPGVVDLLLISCRPFG